MDRRKHKRAVFLDWLELFCSEPSTIPHNAEYFKRNGYEVLERAYGTPQYSEMFTLVEDGFPMIEIRRNPYSLRSQGGIFQPNNCHVRLTNRACYLDSPIDYIRRFLLAHNYQYNALTRIDVCHDFNEFDNGKNPQNFVSDYMKERILKINQSRLAAHGKDNWNERKWNSLKWGSPTSIVSTKLYNKSLEMREQKAKYYIIDRWEECGLDTERDVWRIEFSLKPAAQAQFNKQTGEYVELNLSSYDTPDKLLKRFLVLEEHYFHFKTAVRTSTGTLQRKDRCPDVKLFQIRQPDEECFRPMRILTKDRNPTRTDRMLVKRLKQIADEATDQQTINACNCVISRINFISRMKAQLSDNRATIKLTNEVPGEAITAQRKRFVMWENRERELLEMLMKKYQVPATNITCPF